MSFQSGQRGWTNTSLTGTACSLCVSSLPRPWVWPMCNHLAVPIAGVAEARGFAEGFQQVGSAVVAAVPVSGQALLDQGEQVRGEQGDAIVHWDRSELGGSRCQCTIAPSQSAAETARRGSAKPANRVGRKRQGGRAIARHRRHPAFSRLAVPAVVGAAALAALRMRTTVARAADQDAADASACLALAAKPIDTRSVADFAVPGLDRSVHDRFVAQRMVVHRRVGSLGEVAGERGLAGASFPDYVYGRT